MGPFLDYLGSEDPGLLKRLLELAEEYRGRGSLFADLEIKPELRAVHDGLCEAWRGYLRALVPTAPELPVSAALPIELREQLEMDLGLPPVPDVPSSSPEPVRQPPPDSSASKTPWWNNWVILVAAVAAVVLMWARDTTVVVSNVGNGAIHNVTLRLSQTSSQGQNVVIAEIGPRSLHEFRPPIPSDWSRNQRILLNQVTFTDVSGRTYSRYNVKSGFSSNLQEIKIQIGEAGAVKVAYRDRAWWWRWPALIFLLLIVISRYVRERAKAPWLPPLDFSGSATREN